jgi:hypothetical protein
MDWRRLQHEEPLDEDDAPGAGGDSDDELLGAKSVLNLSFQLSDRVALLAQRKVMRASIVLRRARTCARVPKLGLCAR